MKLKHLVSVVLIIVAIIGFFDIERMALPRYIIYGFSWVYCFAMLIWFIDEYWNKKLF